ncbi:hypothetical protein QYE76_020607 [Lolium multiflorum]|uniref:Uncharacterized protein n=1 Tax=Lolium multiflorum TaxID=4521 RepID=A0AAD8R550_LOLMU|nr:hypothetical protein QYE76_020607 [Lolium multiflorum]
MGAGKDPAGRAASVPPAPEKKKRKKTSSKPAPEASAKLSAHRRHRKPSLPQATGAHANAPPTRSSRDRTAPPPAPLKIKPERRAKGLARGWWATAPGRCILPGLAQPKNTTRLKRAVKEFASAWYDATANVVSTADARKAFEELLWEHRSLGRGAQPAEKEQLIRDHQEALDAQKDISRELKDQAMQAGVRYAEELKAAEAAAEARLNEALEHAGNANVVLQAELEEGAKALKAAERAKPPNSTKLS